MVLMGLDIGPKLKSTVFDVIKLSANHKGTWTQSFRDSVTWLVESYSASRY